MRTTASQCSLRSCSVSRKPFATSDSMAARNSGTLSHKVAQLCQISLRSTRKPTKANSLRDPARYSYFADNGLLCHRCEEHELRCIIEPPMPLENAVFIYIRSNDNARRPVRREERDHSMPSFVNHLPPPAIRVGIRHHSSNPRQNGLEHLHLSFFFFRGLFQ